MPALGRTPLAFIAAALLLAVGCGDDSTADRSDAATDGGADAGPDASLFGAGDTNVCQGKRPGRACGEGKHCEPAGCVFDRCGDGFVQGEEACDDGNDVLGDGCDPACRLDLEGCGNAVVEDDEECDDGNLYDFDECSNACTRNTCGNARIDGHEECDDGNHLDDDECSLDCTENRCRNGRLDRGEECDDGNRIHDDGCSNACLIVLCGNERVEGDEECDDGDTDDGDGCTRTCTASVCGNGRIDPGEVCDGDTVAYACADDCMGMVDDVCRPCEDLHCKAYLGVEGYDVVSACFDAGATGAAVRTVFGVPEVDALFVQNCVDVVDCARRTGCGYDPASVAIDCYCGSKTVDACNAEGPASDAPCRAQWEAATRGPTNLDVLLRISDTTYPSGWAYSVLECDLTLCADDCVPASGP